MTQGLDLTSSYEPNPLLEAIRDHEFYALRCVGDCLLPEVEEGDYALAAPVGNPLNGDFIVIFPYGDELPLAKKLVGGLPPFGIGQKMGAMSEVMPLVMCEQLNPHRQLHIPTSKIAAVHKIIDWLKPEEYRRRFKARRIAAG